MNLTVQVVLHADDEVIAGTAMPATGKSSCFGYLQAYDTEPKRRTPPELSANIINELRRLKWFLWHGNTFHTLQILNDLTLDLDAQDPALAQGKAAKAVREFGGLHHRQHRVYPQLRGAPPRRGDHLHLVRRVHSQPSDQQTHGQKTADAVGPTRYPPAATNPHADPQRHPHPHHRSTEAGRVTSPRFSRSRVAALLNSLDGGAR